MNVRVAIVAVALLTALAGIGPAASVGQTATSVVIDGTPANLVREPDPRGRQFFRTGA